MVVKGWAGLGWWWVGVVVGGVGGKQPKNKPVASRVGESKLNHIKDPFENHLNNICFLVILYIYI